MELRACLIEVDRFKRSLGLRFHNPVRQIASFFVIVLRDIGLTDQINIAAAELRVEHRHIGDVFEDQPLDIGPFAEVVRVGHQFEPITGKTLAPFERPSPDWRLIERGLVGVGLGLKDMLGHHECFSQEGNIGGEGLFHPPGDLGRGDDSDVADQ